MRRDPLSVVDGFQAIAGGVDSDRSPNVLPREQLVWAVNVTTRNQLITCRPGWNQRALQFLDTNGITDPTLRDAFENGLFQGASDYLADNGTASILVSISGHIYLIDALTYTVQDLTLQSGLTLNHPTLPHTWFTQAENFLIIQNGSDLALIYDGATLRRSRWNVGVNEVPTGMAMAYNNGRLWIARPDGYSFIGGNLAYSDGTRAAVLSFTDNDFLTGGAFVIPAGAGPIRAMRSIAIMDSATGQGPLQVFTTRGVFSVNAPFLAEDWAKLTSPIQTISLLSAGSTSDKATINVNGDIWFRAPDGIRSLMIARRDHGTWVNTPLSAEVSRALNTDTPQLLDYASAVLFDNRLLITTQPTPTINHGVYHPGLLALDFAPVSSMFSRTQPVWEGLWTGLRTIQLVIVQTEPARCFAFTLNATTSKIEFWELSVGDRFDATTNRISGFIETPAYPFEDGGWNLKSLAYGDTWLNRIAGTVDLTARYRPDSDPIWQEWTTARYCATLETCDLATCATPATLLEQYRARCRFPTPLDSCDPLTNKPFRHAYRFAVRLEFTGFCQIAQLRLVARSIPEPSDGECPPSTCTISPLTSSCNLSDYSYVIP